MENTNTHTSSKSIKAIITLVILVLIVGASSFFLDKKNDRQDKPRLKAFYLTSDYADEKVTYKIFRVSSKPEKPDELVQTFSTSYKSRFISDSWKKGVALLAANDGADSVIYSIDLYSKNPELKVLITQPIDTAKNQVIKDARFLNEDSIAFISADTVNDRSTNSILRVVSLKDGKETERYELNKKSPIYAGFNFLAQEQGDSSVLYLHETGGDGGGYWTKWFKVDRAAKKVAAISDFPSANKIDGNPVMTEVSPDGKKVAYVDFSGKVADADLDYEMASQSNYERPCLKYWESTAMQRYDKEGGVVMVRDMAEGSKAVELYRNLSYSDNTCKNIARRIVSIQWLSDSLLAYETVDGVYSIDVNTKEIQTIGLFERTYNPGAELRPSLVSIQLPYIVFFDRTVMNVETQKSVKYFSPDAQNSFFFVVE